MNHACAVEITGGIEAEKNPDGLTPIGAFGGCVEESNVEGKMAFVVARQTVGIRRTILEGNDGHGRVHLSWLIKRIRIANANQTPS